MWLRTRDASEGEEEASPSLLEELEEEEDEEEELELEMEASRLR